MPNDLPDWSDTSELLTSLATLTAAINALNAGYGADTTGWATARVLDSPGANGVLVTNPGSGAVIVVMGYLVGWTGTGELRGWWAPRLYGGSGPTAVQIAQPTLSPEHPSHSELFPPKAYTLAANADVGYDLSTRQNVGAIDTLTMYVRYYLE